MNQHAEVLDQYGRMLVWVPQLRAWRSSIQGILTDPKRRDVSQEDRDAEAQSKRLLDCTVQAQALRRKLSSLHRALDDSSCNNDASDNTSGPQGNLTPGPGGSYYDSNDDQWSFCSACTGGDGPDGHWLKWLNPEPVPMDPALQPYVTAGQYADVISPWFQAFAVPIDGEFLPAREGLIARFGLDGALALAERLFGKALARVAAALGESAITRTTGDVANEVTVSP